MNATQVLLVISFIVAAAQSIICNFDKSLGVKLICQSEILVSYILFRFTFIRERKSLLKNHNILLLVAVLSWQIGDIFWGSFYFSKNINVSKQAKFFLTEGFYTLSTIMMFCYSLLRLPKARTGSLLCSAAVVGLFIWHHWLNLANFYPTDLSLRFEETIVTGFIVFMLFFHFSRLALIQSREHLLSASFIVIILSGDLQMRISKHVGGSYYLILASFFVLFGLAGLVLTASASQKTILREKLSETERKFLGRYLVGVGFFSFGYLVSLEIVRSTHLQNIVSLFGISVCILLMIIVLLPRLTSADYISKIFFDPLFSYEEKYKRLLHDLRAPISVIPVAVMKSDLTLLDKISKRFDSILDSDSENNQKIQVKIKDVFVEITQLIHDQFPDARVNVSELSDVKSVLMEDFVSHLFKRSILNLTYNSVESALRKNLEPIVNVHISRNANKLCFEFSDNGDLFSNKRTKNLSRSLSGNGLKIVEEFTDAVGGRITYYRNEGISAPKVRLVIPYLAS